MFSLWIAAAVLSAAAAGLILRRAARAGGPSDSTAAQSVYRRQMDEIADLAQRGLIGPEERRVAEAETGRRLLAEAEAAETGPSPFEAAGKRRGWILAVAALTPLAAMALYVVLGQPTMPDRPFVRRLAEWKRADPAQLGPEQMTAVLRDLARTRPRDATVLAYLARAEAASGDSVMAVRDLQKAVALEPKRADLWLDLGLMSVGEDNSVGADAKVAFEKVLALDPSSQPARYYLARARIAGGDVQGGLADWRSLESAMAADDPNRASLAHEIEAVAGTGALAKPQAAPAGASAQPDPQVFIRNMVASLAARLKAEPNDPAGWARLIRSYRVLGDKAGEAEAEAGVKAAFPNQPDTWKRIEAEAAAAPK